VSTVGGRAAQAPRQILEAAFGTGLERARWPELAPGGGAARLDLVSVAPPVSGERGLQRIAPSTASGEAVNQVVAAAPLSPVRVGVQPNTRAGDGTGAARGDA
jgi:hypothetical protein